MTNEERDIINQFIARVGGEPAAGPAGIRRLGAGDHDPALPPVDPEADRLIGDLFNRYPDARYRITQLAFVQEHALAEAQNRIQRLEWEVQQSAAQQAQQQQSSSSGGGFFGGLFGGGSRSAPPPQQGAPAWNQGAPARLPAGRRRRLRNTRRAISPACSSAPAPGSWAPR